MPLRANIKKVEKELHTIKNDVKSLQKQLTVTQDRKGEVYNCISQLKNIHDQEVWLFSSGSYICYPSYHLCHSYSVFGSSCVRHMESHIVYGFILFKVTGCL